MSTKRKIIQIICLIIGICCFLYPTISGLVNGMSHSELIDDYEKIVNYPADCSEDIIKCQKYNKKLLDMYDRFSMSDEEIEEYKKTMDVGSDVIAYINIPKAGIKEPVYHGTDMITLSQGVGHVMGTSFPVEGKGVHAALSGHAGMASQMIFTNITCLEKGDKFYINSLGRVLTYEVDKIQTVMPTDMRPLDFDREENYCTLITCVPFGINSHRLCVRGKLVSVDDEMPNEDIYKIQRSVSVVDKVNYLFIVFAVLLFGYLCYIVYKTIKSRKNSDKK